MHGALAGVIIVAAGARAQTCTPDWTGTFYEAAINDSVYALRTLDPDGPGPAGPRLYAGGNFTAAGDVFANMIAVWDGQSWAALGDGLAGDEFAIVHDIAAFDPDGDGPKPVSIIATGWFTSAGGTPVKHIAQWDGSQWSSLGAGFSSKGYALEVFDPDGPGDRPPALIAGGSFKTADGLPVGRIASWDGASWSALGGGVPGDYKEVTALLLMDFDGPGPALPVLVAAGGFQEIGGVSARNIAVWNGFSWSALGDGVGHVWALAALDPDGPGELPSEVYAAGDFFYIDNVPFGNIARWDGSTWHPLGVGVDQAVSSLAALDDDGPGPALPALYVGGGFYNAGGIDAPFIARWDGSAWSSLGNGTDEDVLALAAFDPKPGDQTPPRLVAGGVFTLAGGWPSTHIADWGCPSPCYPDFDGDGTLTIFDFLAFVNLFNAADPAADCDASNSLDLFDFLCFTNAFNAGC